MHTLTAQQRRVLRSQAHTLDPVAAIGQNGLSASVIAEIDRCLAAHELIKVRVFSKDRTERIALLAAICDAVDAAPVQHLGNILIVYRELAQPASVKNPKSYTASPRPKLTRRATITATMVSKPRRRAARDSR